ncbi:MAG: hypothetical protein EOM20_03580 [Spartobacteria bacterium]|nr:hypothetical protein [Spartobacteria bacterium]
MKNTNTWMVMCMVLMFAILVSTGMAVTPPPVADAPLAQALKGLWQTDDQTDGKVYYFQFVQTRPFFAVEGNDSPWMTTFYVKEKDALLPLATGVYSLNGDHLEMVATDALARQAAIMVDAHIEIDGDSMTMAISGGTMWPGKDITVSFQRISEE